MSAVLAALAGAATVGGQMLTKKWEMDQQHQYSEAEQQKAYDLSQLAQRNAATNTVEGYKMAGLSPALAAQGNFAPSSILNAPSKVHAEGINPKLIESAQLSLLDSQIRVNDSEAAKNNAAAGLSGAQQQNQVLVNARMTQEDLTARTLVQDHLRSMLDSPAVKNDPELSAATEMLLEAANSSQFNLGSIRGSKEFIQMVADGNKAAIDKVKAVYENSMYDYYLNSGKPEIDLNLVKTQIAKNSADVLRASADMALAYSNINLNSSKAQELTASAAHHLADASLSYSKDFAAQFKNDDYEALGVNVGMQIIGGVSSGVGFGAGAKLLGAGARKIGVANGGKSVSKTAMDAGNRLKSVKVGKQSTPGYNYKPAIVGETRKVFRRVDLSSASNRKKLLEASKSFPRRD